MIYKEFQGLKLSELGMGTMRLPLLDDDYGNINETIAQEMVDYAMSQGINYYDTAWGYHNGNSETFMGKALSKYPRDSYYIATKFPGYDLTNMDKVEEIFEKQLEKCKVEYFDFYLFHNVCEMNIDAYLNPKYGIYDYLIKQKESGRIRHLGFSVHGSYDVMKRFLEAYGEQIEFVQIQLNYVDWSFQDAKSKVELAQEYHIPVWVMEPLRGGKLASLSDEYSEKLKTLRPLESDVAWAFRFIQSIPSVKVVLTGASNFEQLEQNISIFSEDKPLNEEESSMLFDIAENSINKATVPCTACQYCVDHCPKDLNINRLIELYNEHVFTQGGFIAPMALMSIEPEKQPSACIGCRSCENVCPQQIKIANVMDNFVKKLSS